MKWKKLSESKNDFGRGHVFRCPGQYPYEGFVDFMMVSCPVDSPSGHGFVVTSGHKAGFIFGHLPEEASLKGGIGISGEWLKANWSKWVYLDAKVEDVYFCRKYEIELNWNKKAL